MFFVDCFYTMKFYSRKHKNATIHKLCNMFLSIRRTNKMYGSDMWPCVAHSVYAEVVQGRRVECLNSVISYLQIKKECPICRRQITANEILVWFFVSFINYNSHSQRYISAIRTIVINLLVMMSSNKCIVYVKQYVLLF
jgi:hypothetical protein